MDDELEQSVRMAMYNLMTIFYENGITEVHIGGMMRIMGIDNEIAAKHDNEAMVLDEGFVEYVNELNTPRPPNETLH